MTSAGPSQRCSYLVSMLSETVLILSLTVCCCLQTLPRQLVFIIVTMWYLTCSCKLGTISY